MFQTYYGQARARQDTTVSTAVVTLDATKYRGSDGRGARAALITVEAQPIRYTRDGTDPNNGTTTGDIHAADNHPLLLIGTESIARFKAIRSGATDATIHVTYYF